jgi:hypothetical protein
MSRHTCSGKCYRKWYSDRWDVRALAHGGNSKDNMRVLTKRERREHEVCINASTHKRLRKSALFMKLLSPAVPRASLNDSFAALTSFLNFPSER